MNNEEIQELERKRFEYSMLRDEIIIIEQQRDNFCIAMYTLAIAILGVTYEANNKFLLFLVFAVTIPFQGLINIRQEDMMKCGAYLKIYFESDYYMPKWEDLGHKSRTIYLKSHVKSNIFQNFAYHIARWGSALFATVAFVSYIFYTVSENIWASFETTQILYVIIMFFMCCISVFINYRELKSGDVYQKYQEIFKNLKNNTKDAL